MASELEKLRKSLSADSKKRAKQTFQSQQRTISSTGNTPVDKNKIGQNLERQKRKEERLENVRDFLEEFGKKRETTAPTTSRYANRYGSSVKPPGEEDNLAQWAGKQAMRGISTFNEGFTQGIDWVLPTEVLFGEGNRFDRFLDSYTTDREMFEQRAKTSSDSKGGKGWGLAGDLLAGTVQTLPNLAFAGVGAAGQGASLASQAAASSGGILNTIRTTAASLSKNPAFWNSFLQSTGMDYAESKALGQDDIKATVSAFTTGLINAAIEMGGGLETLPAALKSGNKSLIRTWIGNALDEGKEEVVQGIISGLVDKIQMGESLFEGDNVFDPRRMATEFGMGTAVGGILGGATTGLSAMADYGARADLGSRIRRESPYYADEVVERGLASDADSAFYAEATKALERLNKGKTLSDAQLGGLYREERLNANREFNYDTAGYLNELISEHGRNAEKSDISRVVELYGDSGKKALSNNYRPEDDFLTYSSGFFDYYKAGAMGTDVDKVESEYDVMPHVKEAAYMAGKNDTLAAKTEQTERAEFTTVNSNKAGFVNTDASQGVSRGLKKTLNIMGQAADAKIMFEGQVEEGKANGRLSGDVISIARDSENPYFVVAVHEGTHRLKVTAPKEYDAFKNYALELASKMSGKSVDEVIAQKIKQYAEGGVALTPEGAEDEIVAEFAESLFANEQELRAFVSKADRTVVQKIFEAIRDFLDKLKKLRKRKDLDAETLEQLGLAISEVEKAKQLWGKALEATQSKKGKAGKETQNEQQYSFKDALKVDNKDSFGRKLNNEQIEYFKDSKVRDAEGNLKVLYHGTPTAGFTEFDLDRNHVYMTDNIEVAKGYSGTDEIFEHISEWDFKTLAKWAGDDFTKYVKKDGVYQVIVTKRGEQFVDFTATTLDELKEYAIEQNGEPEMASNYELYANITNPLVVDAKGAYADEIVFNGETHTTEDIAEYAQRNEYDGVIFENIHDISTTASRSGHVESNVYVAFAPEQVKLRTNRRPTSGTDIRYSLKQEAENIGLEYDEKTNSLAPQYSLKTWQSSKYVQDREKTVRDLSKKMGVSTDEIEKYLKDISSVASIILADSERLDYESNVDPNASVLKKNSEYTWTLDMSTLCAKRLIYTGTMDAIQKALPNAVLTSEDIVEIRDRMMKKGYEVACGICYVESTRREMGAITQQFIDRYKEAQKTGKPISRLNSKGEAVELSETGNKNKRFYADKDWTPTLADLNTTAIDQVKMEHPEAYGAYLSFMNARGQAKPKLLETRAEYKHEIAKWNKSTVNSRNAAGGLRVQSFSDFEVPHMIDMMQAVFDMYTVGLKSQAYTKVPEFAAVFGDTGMKINLSLIAKDDGLDADGNLIFDDVEGIDHKRAFELREQYSKNVGTILVGKTFNHIVKALADPRIDFVIPFHKSSWKESLYDKLGLTGYEDFTATQNEKSIDPNRKIKNFDPSEYWDFSKTGDENAQIYLEKCREDGRIPKFPEFSHYPGYWKLLIDFKMYDNDGAGSPQIPVEPNFNMEAAEQILADYEEGHRSFPVAQDVVDEFVNNYKESGRTYSLKGQSNILKENARLKKYNDYLKNELKLTKDIKPDKKAMQKLTKDVLKEYKSTVPAAEIQPQLDELYNYLTTPGADWNEAKNKALNIASDMLRDATAVDSELQQEFKDFKEYLKDYRISISEEAKGDFKGEWNQFRKRNFGWLTLTNDGENIDKVYQGLADMFPEYVDSEITNEADQLMEVERAYNLLKNVEYNPYSSDMEVAAEYLANDIIDRFFDIPRAKPTFSDKKQTQIDRIRQDSRERVKAAVKKEREKNEKKLQTYKEQQKESRKKMSDKRKRKIMRDKILRHIKPMQKKLLSPTDKQHVPEELRTSVAAVLACIDTSSNRLNSKGEETKRTKAFASAKEQLLAIAGETNLDPALFGGGDNKNNFEDLFNTLSEKKLDDMNIEELKTAWEVVKAMETAIQNYNKTLAKARYATIDGWADAFDASVSERKPKSQNKPNELSLDMQTPITFFNNFGQAGRDFFKMLRDAQDYESSILAELADKVADVVSRKQRKKFEKEQHVFELENGKTITLSTAHIMELYVGVRRKEFAHHLYVGGMYQPEIGKVARGTESLDVTEADTAKMFKELTQEQKNIADGMQKLTLFLAEKGNIASMKAYGYEKFTDPNYWTIDSVKESVRRDVDKNSKTHPRSIANMGSAQPLKENAATPLEIKGMFKTFDQHTVDMSTYAAWLLPMEDSNRLFNYQFKTQDADGNWIPIKNKKIVGMINKYAGKGGDDYWLNLMTDIQNGLGKTADTATGRLINKIINNVKKASVAGNLRVIAQQPTAYLRVFAVLDLRDMEIATAKFKATPGKGWEKALKYAPIAVRKSMGGFDISTSTLEDYLYTDKKKNGKDKIPLKELPLLGASKADEITWGWIWNACEANIQRTQPSLDVGSEEFYDVVAEKFADVINQTQVVDGVLQRSQIMRSSSENVQSVSMFMGEPITSLNLVYRVYDMLRYATGKERSGAFKKLGKSTMALLASSVAVAVAQSLPDAARDDESDEDYFRRFLEALTGITGKEETWWELAKNVAIGGNLGNSLNVLSWHPYLNEFMSLYQGFTSERLDAQTFGNLISSIKGLYGAFTGDSKMTIAQATRKTLETGAKLLGSSVANVSRDVESILRSVLTGTDNWYAHYKIEKLKYKVEDSPNHFTDIAYLALMHEDYSDYEAIRADMIANGVSEKKIDARLKKKALDNDTATKEAYDNLVAELEREGLGSLDKEVQDEILKNAEAYVISTNLRQLSRDSYKEEYDWITEAQNSKQNLGISTAEYIMLKEEYGSKTLGTENIKKAHADGVIDTETYLEYNKVSNSTKSDESGKKQDKLRSYLKNSGLTNEEQLYVWKNVFGYKSWY